MNQTNKSQIREKLPYSKPELVAYGKITDVTQKSGGDEDGGAAMMNKSGGG
jgi:hypothetical protein